MDSSFRFPMLRGFFNIFLCVCPKRGCKMSEMIIEHPIMIIENLLKMGKGDEGRLLYLRKALIDGKTIYESDKKYLKKMNDLLNQNQDNTSIPKHSTLPIEQNIEKKIKNERNLSESNSKKYLVGDIFKFDSFDFELQTLHNSIIDLKKKESHIKDNLELIALNREILTQHEFDKSNTFGAFLNLPKKSSSDLFDLIATKPNLENSQFFKLPKYSLMTCVSASLFSLWWAGFQNLIDLGSLQGLLLGFSAGSATAAGLFYKKEKNVK